MKPGDRVVCVESFPVRPVKKGDIFTVESVEWCCREHVNLKEDPSIRHLITGKRVGCHKCRHQFVGYVYIASKFRKLDTNYNTNALTKKLSKDIQRELEEVDKEPDKVEIEK